MSPLDRPTGVDSPRGLAFVVDDQPLVRELVADFVAEAGFEVLEAGTADAALELLAMRADPNILVTDVEMPGTLNGLDLAWLVRQAHPGVAVVIVSGRYIPSAEEFPGSSTFLRKPFSGPQLMSAIRRAIAEVANASRR